MSQRQYLPAISLKNNSISVALSNRRRNISFDSINFSTQGSADHGKESPLPIKKVSKISYSSKKSHLFDCFDKKKIKDYTKRCQQRMETYINDKKELADINLCRKLAYKQHSQSFDKKYVKFETINHLNGIHNFPLKKKVNIKFRIHSKPNNRAQTLRNDFQEQDFQQNISLRKCKSPQETYSKRYNDLSLKQIIQCDLEFIQKKDKIHQKQQLKELQQKILIFKDTISYQQPLKGW